jgi:hypothetical protein
MADIVLLVVFPWNQICEQLKLKSLSLNRDIAANCDWDHSKGKKERNFFF